MGNDHSRRDHHHTLDDVTQPLSAQRRRPWSQRYGLAPKKYANQRLVPDEATMGTTTQNEIDEQSMEDEEERVVPLNKVVSPPAQTFGSGGGTRKIWVTDNEQERQLQAQSQPQQDLVYQNSDQIIQAQSRPYPAKIYREEIEPPKKVKKSQEMSAREPLTPPPQPLNSATNNPNTSFLSNTGQRIAKGMTTSPFSRRPTNQSQVYSSSEDEGEQEQAANVNRVAINRAEQQGGQEQPFGGDLHHHKIPLDQSKRQSRTSNATQKPKLKQKTKRDKRGQYQQTAEQDLESFDTESNEEGIAEEGESKEDLELKLQQIMEIEKISHNISDIEKEVHNLLTDETRRNLPKDKYEYKIKWCDEMLTREMLKLDTVVGDDEVKRHRKKQIKRIQNLLNKLDELRLGV